VRRKAFEEARCKDEASRKAEEERRKAIEEASRKAEEERHKVIEEASRKAEEERCKTALAAAMKEATKQNRRQQGARSGVPREIEQSHTTDSAESGLTAESLSAKRTLDQSQEEGHPENNLLKRKGGGPSSQASGVSFQTAVEEDGEVEETYESPSKYHVYGDDDDNGLEDQLEKEKAMRNARKGGDPPMNTTTASTSGPANPSTSPLHGASATTNMTGQNVTFNIGTSSSHSSDTATTLRRSHRPKKPKRKV
jgi:hypothetical protein